MADDNDIEYGRPETIDGEGESIEEQLLDSNLKYMSSDTQTFRVGIFKKLLKMEERLCSVTCYADKKTVEKHEKVLGDLDKRLDLLKQATEIGLSGVATELKRLADCKDTNADNIGRLEKAIGKVNDKVNEGRTALRVSLFWIGAFWILSLAVIGAFVYLHDRVPHANSATTIDAPPPMPIKLVNNMPTVADTNKKTK